MQDISYDRIAAEYYETTHVTCRNFDATCKVAAAEFLPQMPSFGLVLDVGCGRGRCQEYLGLNVDRVVQLDASKEMFRIATRERALIRVRGDATSIPLDDGQFAAVIGFLADPFIGLQFFAEAFRVLRPQGVLFLTTPTYEWGSALRGNKEPAISYAKFIIKTKEPVLVPSTLLPASRVQEMLEYTGFSNIVIRSHTLPPGTQPLSPDIQSAATARNVDVYKLPIIDAISGNKT